jgi:CDP-glucose 4,6-dehydratase
MLLKALGAEIAGLSLPAETPSHFRMLGLAGELQHMEGDIRESTVVARAFSDFKPDVVFHLAAQALVRPSYDDPKLTFDTNVGGSVNVLEAVRLGDTVRALVYVTSDKCYENKEWLWGYRENDSMGGRDPYSASKAAAELVFSAYSSSFFDQRPELGVASVRAGNVIGGGDWAKDRIVPDCVRALQKSKSVIVRNPSATRPWQHVLDPLIGYVQLGRMLMERPAHFSGAWNFGPDDDDIRTVQVLAEAFVAVWGSGEIHIAEQADTTKHESHTLHLSCEKAHRILGWHPHWDFDRTIGETARWYRHVHDGGEALAITSEQVRSFLSTC